MALPFTRVMLKLASLVNVLQWCSTLEGVGSVQGALVRVRRPGCRRLSLAGLGQVASSESQLSSLGAGDVCPLG